MTSTEERLIASVVQWIKLDDRARAISAEARGIRQQKKAMEEGILSMMDEHEQDVLNLSTGGTLRRGVSKCRSGLKEEYVKGMLAKLTNSQEQAASMTEALLKNRPVTEKQYLKRCLPRKPRAPQG